MIQNEVMPDAKTYALFFEKNVASNDLFRANQNLKKVLEYTNEHGQ